MLALVIVGCANASDDAASSSTTLDPTISATPSTTTTRATPSTTTTQATATTSPTTTTTVFPPTDFDCPPVLVSGRETVRIDAGCSVIPLSVSPAPDTRRGGPLLFDDLAGGLLFQTDQKVIWWQESGGAGPRELVVAADDESVSLQDVSLVEGRVEAWFTRDRGSTIEDHVQILERVVIDGGEPSVVAETGAWESSSTVTVGGEVVAREHGAEGFYSFGLTDLQLSSPGSTSQPWNPYSEMEMDDTFLCDACPVGLIVSDDGRLVAYRDRGGNAADIAVLVVVDLESGEETHLEISGIGAPNNATGPYVGGLDLLGDLALVNISNELGQPLAARWVDLFDEGAAWTELPFRGDARFLRSDVQFGESESG